MDQPLPSGSAEPLAAAPPHDLISGDDPSLQEIVYDPAEYRWVPVRRRARRDGWTEEKMRRFIETLADTGDVSAAAKAVGLSRESAYQLKRQPHAAAFARAWDAARHHAGGFLEDVAFERAIEGVEHHVYNDVGDVICTKRVVSDRLLMFLLRNLKPERYGRAALADTPPPPEPVETSLRALEPPLPAAPEQLLGPEQLDDALELAEIADGTLPHFLSEQRPQRPEPRTPDEKHAARIRRGEAAHAKECRGETLTDEEYRDLCVFHDPASRPGNSRKRYR